MEKELIGAQFMQQNAKVTAPSMYPQEKVMTSIRRRAGQLIGTALLVGVLAATISASAALAQYGQAPQGNPAANPMVQELAHQAAVEKIEQVEREVEQNPALLSNPEFLGAHPSLGRFLSSHPEAATLIQQNPQAFFAAFNREHGLPSPPQQPPPY